MAAAAKIILILFFVFFPGHPTVTLAKDQDTQAIIPSMKFITNGTLHAWILAADFGGSELPPYTELQIWRPINRGKYLKIGFSNITMGDNSIIYRINMKEPLYYEAGDIIGYYQSRSRHRVKFEGIESGRHLLYYKNNENGPAETFNVASKSGTNTKIHALISVIADGAVGFMSVGTIEHLVGPVPLKNRHFLAPSLRFNCRGKIVKWIFGVKWASGSVYPEVQLWNERNNRYTLINSTVLRITKIDNKNVYEYRNVPPILVDDGFVLGLSVPPENKTRFMLVAEGGIGSSTVLSSQYKSKDVLWRQNTSQLVYQPLISPVLVPLSTSVMPLSSSVLAPTSKQDDNDISVGVSGGTLSVVVVAIFIAVATTLFLYVRKKKRKSEREIQRSVALNACSPMPDYDVLTSPMHSTGINHSVHTLSDCKVVDKRDLDTGPCEAKCFNADYYVPTKDQRKRSNSENSSYIRAREDELFMEKKEFWSPGTSLDSIFEQLFQHKFREIEMMHIRVGGSLGTGEFGVVSRGKWIAGVRGQMEVAIKTLRPAAKEDIQIKFLQEAAIIGQFKHCNIVKLYGVVTTQEPMMLVMEFMANGDLRNHLVSLTTNPDEPTQAELSRLCLSFCQQIASGMSYLADKAFVHRDLAARNILVSDTQVCKVSDFGMSRALQHGSDSYHSKGGKIPVKWTAPEAIYYLEYSTASDVWSFGCVMYEIWSFGHKPFETYTNAESMERVTDGIRLSPPPGCPRNIYSQMIDCWHPEASVRPSFHTLCQTLAEEADTLLHWIEEYSQCHPEAHLLGAPIEAGALLYPKLQESYKKTL